MMLNETYTKNIQPRDPERIRSDIETPCATVYNQGVTPVLYDNAVQASSRPGRAVEYLPENTIANGKPFTAREINQMQNRIVKLNNIIAILKTVNCTVSAPLRERLVALETLYGQYML